MRLIPGMMKKAEGWDDAWDKTKLALLYGLGTAAVGAGAYYLYDKEHVKKIIHDQLHKVQKNIEAKKMRKGDKDRFFKLRPTITPSGPGVMASAGPVGISAHPTGVGLALNVNKNTIGNVLSKVPFVSEKEADKIVKPLPPNVFAGVDVGLGTPLTGGVVLDTSNKAQTIEALKNAKSLLKDPNIEKKIDRKIYSKVKDIGASVLPTVTMEKGASMYINENACRMGYSKQGMEKTAVPAILPLLGWGAFAGMGAYDAAKQSPEAYKAFKEGRYKDAAKLSGRIGLDVAGGVVPMSGAVLRTVGKGGRALEAATKAGTAEKGVLETAKAVKGAEALQNMTQQADKLNSVIQQNAGKADWFSKWKTSRAQNQLDALNKKWTNQMTPKAPGVFSNMTQPVRNAWNATNYIGVHQMAKNPQMSQKYLEWLNKAQKNPLWRGVEWTGEGMPMAGLTVAQMGGKKLIGPTSTELAAQQNQPPSQTPA